MMSSLTDQPDTISSDLFRIESSHHPSQDEVCISRFEVVLPHSSSSLFLGCDDGQLARTGDLVGEELQEFHEIVGTGDRHRNLDVQEDDRLQRRSKKRRSSVFVTISHKLSTGLEQVGMQLWRGALLLADYLLSREEEYWRGRTAVELGAGVGFVGVLLTLVPCRRIFLTDMSASMAELMDKNLATNDHIRSHRIHPQSPFPEVCTRVLDWRRESSLQFRSSSSPTPASTPTVSDGSWSWTVQDTRALSGEDVLWLAADVIYDDEVTAQLFRLLTRVMKPGDRLLLALEKRFNFEVPTLSLVAHGYELFRKYVNVGRGVGGKHERVSVNSDKPQRQQGEEWKEKESVQVAFMGELVPLDFPQSVLGYHRGADLELWSIALCDEEQ
mmetsp:Transcript_29218/g.54211  ORF Transcript_29218/g.54211 Transcript_29218/m.54211 type:complete len:385 (+) Transcript_29218:66-1220(+)